jgi:tetratricopeptide (TPR) repeat protein
MPDQPAAESNIARDGQIITFYSFKGGTGRTMALANVAWILAANGFRVLAADWDLESPGLDRFFQPFLAEQEVRDSPGIIDLIRAYRQTAMKTPPENRAEIFRPLARVEPYAFSLDWEFAGGGCLDLLSPGKLNLDYAAALSAMDWDNFYQALDGGEFLDAFRTELKRSYDYVLIDSRTGFSDIAEICTVHLPDVLVDCFTLSTQGIEGAAEVANRVGKRNGDRPIRLLPVPMRVDQAEKKKVDEGRLVAMRHFHGLPEHMTDAQRREYWAAVEIPYQAFYAYEETLAVFGDKPDLPGSLLAAFERLTARLTDDAVTRLPQVSEQIRQRTADMFTRSVPLAGELIVLESLAEDQAWAEWIAAVLEDADIEVRHHRLDEPDTPSSGEPEASAKRFARSLVLVSPSYMARRRRLNLPEAKPDLAVYVTPSSSLIEFASAAAVFLSGVQEAEAIERLRRLLGLSGRPTADNVTARLRYPGAEPRIFERAPARNVQFTGRAEDLNRLRAQLHEQDTGSSARIALQGLGGVGKTQLAMEYVQRFRTDYDLVWWIDCERPAFIDASLADLGERMRTDFGINVVPSANVGEVTRQVLDVLGRGEQRWLLVFDNADETDVIGQFVPSGGGHVLITSRNRAWAEQGAQLLPVDVFTREESVAHLQQRVSGMATQEAEQIAIALGDLPLAVATTGALLAETGYTVSSFLDELERQPERTLGSISLLSQHPERVSRAWDVSLNRLALRFPAAMRLLELCSVMAPRVSLNLIYTPEMASLLEPFDSELKDDMVMGRVVQEINRLALIKLDSGNRELVVHVLVQEVVRDRMSERLDGARRDVHDILVTARPRREVADPATWSRYRLIWPHLDASRAMSSDDPRIRQLYIDRVRYLYIRGDLERGRLIAREAEQVWEAMETGTSDQETAKTLHNQLLQLRFHLGNILRQQARFAEARELDEQVLAEQRELLGPNHPHTLMTAGSLAADLRAAGRYREALDMDQRTYTAWTELYGEDHPQTLMAANNLGVSLRLSGETTDAMRRNADTYERRRAALGTRDRWTLSSARAVAWTMVEAGEYAEALVQAQDAYRTARDVLGTDEVVTLELQVLLGIALRSTGRPTEAEEAFQAAFAELIVRFGESASEALACRLSRATNLLSLNRNVEGAAEIRRVLAAYEERLGLEHPNVLACRLNLAAALRYNNELEDATEAIRAAEQGFTARLGDAHPYTLAARMSQGVLHAIRGELDEAETIEMATAVAMATRLGQNHPDTLRCQANLLLTKHERGDHTAIAARTAVIDKLASLIGEDHPNIVTLRAERRLMRSVDPQPF